MIVKLMLTVPQLAAAVDFIGSEKNLIPAPPGFMWAFAVKGEGAALEKTIRFAKLKDHKKAGGVLSAVFEVVTAMTVLKADDAITWIAVGDDEKLESRKIPLEAMVDFFSALGLFPPATADWTLDDAGTINASELYEECCQTVERTIKDGANDLLCGDVRVVARIIMARLADKHQVGPLTATLQT